VFRLLLMPTRAYMKAMTLAANALLRTISRVAGSEIVEDAMAFSELSKGWKRASGTGHAVSRTCWRTWNGLRARGGAARGLDRRGAFLRPTPGRKLHSCERNGREPSLLQLRPEPATAVRSTAQGNDGPSPTQTRLVAPDSAPADPRAYGELLRNLDEFLCVASREERYVADLAGQVQPAPVVRVPFLSEDVHDIEGLQAVARHLLGGQLISDRGSHPDRQ